MSEHDQQTALIEWFEIQYPNLKELLIAIPNGAVLCDLTKHKRIARMNYLKKEGFKKGIPDLFLAVPSNNFGGLWIEMKDIGKGYSEVRKEQRFYLAKFLSVGYDAHWAAGFEDAQRIIIDYLSGN